MIDCDFSSVYALIVLLPLECFQVRFMQQALFGLLLLAPMAAVLGIEIINFRMAFFSDAVGHSAFTGVACGLILSVDPRLSMPVFGVLTGLAIMAMRRNTSFSSDTVTGIIFSGVVAFGLAVVSRADGMARDMQQFLYGDILTISEREISMLLLLFVVMLFFQFLGYNNLFSIALNPVTAKVRGVRVALWQYFFAGLLALVVMYSVWAVGVLLVTAMLIVPAAAARNLARTAGGMFWWAIVVAQTSAFAGLALSAQDWLSTASGATVILVACCWFAVSAVCAAARDH
ncbi:MAG: metal ABC transporter permease [Desulfovibrio sp.]|nr:metal ABC transporter permease [Desulfovibrio sp.]